MTNVESKLPEHRRFRRPAAAQRRIAAGALAVAAVALAATSPGPLPAKSATLAPRAQAQAQAGMLDLSAYRGKVVYLDFWASWCGPCRLSFPFMNQLRYGSLRDDLVVIAVNVDHDSAAARRFLREHPANFTVIYDASGKTASRFKVADMPTSILIGKDGRVRYVHKGFFEKDEPVYRQHIAELLREK